MNWRTVALQAWNGYKAALAMVWSPFVAVLAFIRKWSLLILPLLVIAFAGGMWWMVDSANTHKTSDALIGLAVAFPAALLLAALIWIYVVRLRIGIDLLQIPAGEIAEVLREGGQLVRLQDPQVRDGEGNIRLFNSARIMAVGKRAFCLPAWVLTMGAWLAALPHTLTLVVVGMVSLGGLAAAFWLRQRGRKVGLGFDFLAGAMLHYIFGGVALILFRAAMTSLLPVWTAILTGSLDGSIAAMPAAVGLDGLLGNVTWRLLHGWIGWPPGVGDVFAVVFGALILLGFIGYQVAVIAAIVRLLKEPPEGEARLGAKSASPGITVIGTVGRGDSGFSGPAMNGWIWSAFGFGLLAAVVWLMNRYAAGEWTCRFGSPLFTLVVALGVIALVVGLLRQYWPRVATALGVLAVACALFGFLNDALGHWDGRRAACDVADHPDRTTTAAPVYAAPPESPPPPRRSDPWAPARAEDARIRAYFAEHSDECPDAAARSGYEAYRDAVGACRSEQWRIAYSDYGR